MYRSPLFISFRGRGVSEGARIDHQHLGSRFPRAGLFPCGCTFLTDTGLSFSSFVRGCRIRVCPLSFGAKNLPVTTTPVLGALPSCRPPHAVQEHSHFRNAPWLAFLPSFDATRLWQWPRNAYGASPWPVLSDIWRIPLLEWAADGSIECAGWLTGAVARVHTGVTVSSLLCVHGKSECQDQCVAVLLALLSRCF